MGASRLLVLASLLLGAALVPAVAAAPLTVQVTATIVRTSVGYGLSITNTGDEPVKCFRFELAEGVEATNIGALPVGWQVGAPTQPPSPVLIGKGDPGIAPGATTVFPFTTDIPYPAGAGGILKASADCKQDFGFFVTGPPAVESTPSPKPKPPQKCTCKRLEARITDAERSPIRENLPNDRRVSIAFDLSWELECTGGTGGCEGTLSLPPPAGLKYRDELTLDTPQSGSETLKCKGPCRKTTRPKREKILVLLGPQRYAKERIVLRIETTCRGKEQLRFYTLVFKHDGGSFLDRARSDLDGNRIPDRKE